jgi:hypothetical protein
MALRIGTRVFASGIQVGPIKRSGAMIVWGQYFNEADDIIGVDLLRLTKTTSRIRHLSDLYLTRGDFKNPTRHTQNCQLETSRIMTISTNDNDFQTSDETLRTRLFPDIIARRAQSITSNPQATYSCRFDFSQASYHVGFTFSSITSQMATNDHCPADLQEHLDAHGIERRLPKNTDFSAEDIDQIAKWAMCRRTYARDHDLSSDAVWEKSGKWPVWNSTVDSFGHAVSCAAAQATPQAQKPKTDEQSSANARKKFANRYGGLGL